MEMGRVVGRTLTTNQVAQAWKQGTEVKALEMKHTAKALVSEWKQLGLLDDN